jgi:hypothetical protein
MIQGVQAVATPPVIYGSAVSSGNVYYGSENSLMGILDVIGANTGMTQMAACDVGGLDGLPPLAQLSDGTNFYTAYSNGTGGTTIYPNFNPPSCTGSTPVSLSTISNVTAKSLAIAVNPADNFDHRIVMSAIDGITHFTHLFVIDPMNPGTPTTLVDDMNIKFVNGVTEPPHPLAVDSKGIVYYADSNGALRSVDVFGKSPAVPSTSVLSSDAFGVAVSGTTLFFTSKAFGVRSEPLPLKM